MSTGATGGGGTGGTASGGTGGTASGGTGGTAGSAGSLGTGGSGGTAGSGALACDLGGTWGTYLSIPVDWPGTTVLREGSGTIQLWLLHQRTQAGLDVNDSIRLCGVQIPSFQAGLIGGNEKYGVRFLAQAFDAGIPEVAGHAVLAADSPETAFASDAIAIVFGVNLANPLIDLWPKGSALSPRDDDHDTQPGLTVPALKGNGFFGPPVNFLKSARATDLYIASRSVAKLTGDVTGCSDVNGKVMVQTIGESPAIDSHIVGCRLENGQACSTGDTEFADSNEPDFHPTGDGQFTMRRFASADCGVIRGAFLGQP